ncbi:MAG: DMT family transporter [Rhodospirillaceae bacterium]|nr:DMT family transporter [Rhodospirillaceae bacterium]
MTVMGGSAGVAPGALRAAALILPPAIWASLIVVGTEAMVAVPPLALTVASWFIAALTLLPLAISEMRGRLGQLAIEAPWILMLGVTGTTGFQYLWFEGLSRANPVNVAILTPTLPVFVAVAACLLLKELRGWAVFSGAVLILFATLLLATEAQPDRLLSLRLGSGELLILAANVLMTVYTIGLRLRPTRLPAILFLWAVITAGLAPLLLIAALVPGIWPGTDGVSRHVPALIYLGVVAYVIAYLLWNYSVTVNGAALSGLFLYLQPILGIALAALYLDLPVHWYHAASISLALLGLMCVLDWREVLRRGVRT